MPYKRAILVLVILCAYSIAYAASLGHYSPDSNGVRDYILPSEKGFSLAAYNMYYSSDSFREGGGTKFRSLTASGSAQDRVMIKGKPIPITITGNATADFDFKAREFSQSLDLTWAPEVKFLGADYAFVISPSWGYSFFEAKANANAGCTVSVGDLSKTLSAGGSEKFKEENTGFGDLYVQPLWFAWRNKHYDLGLSYGFYAPTGYNKKNGMANIGLGYWTQQLQANVYWFPFINQATAFVIRPTYEWNSRKIHEDYQPGQTMTFEYGVSQKVQTRTEIAILGYDQLQLTGERGSASTDKKALSFTAGIGALINYQIIKDKCSIAAKFNREYNTKFNFSGDAWSLDVKWVF